MGARYGIPNWTTQESKPLDLALDEDIQRLHQSLAQKMRDIATRQSNEKDLDQYNLIIRMITAEAEQNQALDLHVEFAIRPGTISMLEKEGFVVKEDHPFSGEIAFTISW